MSTAGILEKINSVEDTFEVQSWRYRDIPLWPMVRLMVAGRLSSSAAQSEPRSRVAHALDFFDLCGSIAKELISDFPNTRIRYSPCDVFISTHNFGRQEVAGRFYSSYMQGVVELFAGSRVFLQERCSASTASRIPKGVRTFLLPEFIYNHLARFLQLLIRPKALCMPGKAKVAHAFGLRTRDLSVRRLVATVLFWKHYYAIVLKVLRPRIAVFTCFYDLQNYGLVLACRSKSVATMEYQHGVQGPQHLAYARWNRIPATGYCIMPDWFLNWQPGDAATINEWAAATCRHRAIDVGNLWMRFIRSRLDADGRVSKAAWAESRPGILYTLQNHLPGPEALDALARLQDRYRLLFRLHPGYGFLRGRLIAALKEHGIAGYDLDECTRLPLPLVLMKSVLHITQYSSVVDEAAEMGIPSIVTHEYGQRLYNRLIADGMVVHSPDLREPDLDSLIARMTRMRIPSRRSLEEDDRRTSNIEQLREMTR